MALKKHDPHQILAYGQVDTRLAALDQDLEPDALHVLAEDFIVTGMRYIKAGVDSRDQGVLGRHDPV